VAPLAWAFFYTRKFFLLPAFDFSLIAFPRPAFGFLAAPMQEFPHYFPHVAFVVLNPEKLLNQARHALGSPQLVGPAVSFCTLPEQELQVMKLRFIQLRLGSGMGNGFQPVRAVAIQVAPAVKRPTGHAQNLSNLGMGLAAFHHFNSASTPPFELVCRAEGSHACWYRHIFLATLAVRGAINVRLQRWRPQWSTSDNSLEDLYIEIFLRKLNSLPML